MKRILIYLMLLTLILTSLPGNIISAEGQGFDVPKDKFMFVEAYTDARGVGDVGMPLAEDFPEYKFDNSTGILTSYAQVSNYGENTKVVVGKGNGLSGTAGSGAFTYLTAYDNISESSLYYFDNDGTAHFYWNNEWYTAKIGETVTKQVEKAAEKGSGKYIYTYYVTNHGLISRGNFQLPLLVPTTTPSITPTPTVTPAQLITPTDNLKKYKIRGCLKTDLGVNKDLSGFKVEIPDVGIKTYTDNTGYFEAEGTFVSGGRYSVSISKEKYLKREFDIYPYNNLIIGAQDSPVEMISGDVSLDNAINMQDVIALATAFNSTRGDGRYKESIDINSDGSINMADVMFIARNFNKTSVDYENPFIAEYNEVRVKIGDTFKIVQSEGGYIGLTWKYAISNSIVRLDSSTVENPAYPDAYYNHIWIFKAYAAGTSNILFSPSISTVIPKLYIVTAEGAIASNTPTNILTITPPPTTPAPSSDPNINRNTTMTAFADYSLNAGNNVVFCPTFQMAWDGLKETVGGDVELEGQPELANILNKGFNMENCISEDSYLAMTGCGDETVDKINSALKIKFGDDAPKVDKIGEGTYISYAYLLKQAMFEKAFEDTNGLMFNSNGETTQVNSFGIPSGSRRMSDLSKQVEVYDYKNNNDFIVKLLPQNSNEEIILAKVTPDTTLYKTYTRVMNRINNSSASYVGLSDSLSIPVINIDQEINYDELCKGILNPALSDYTIGKAYQNLKFTLNKNGARLASEATILATPMAMNPKKLTFDKQFMICLRQKNSQNPYLLVWVDNAEVLSKVK
ncbi:MAG: dockerin type I domain-containing protein [Bacillota bacterium]|nr:dockerin type I domain-containing protein [Bacillota bacterium]